jgi:biotin carboxyl carrier protein
MQGTILHVMVEPGQAIVAGQVVCILEAMKMENHIQAHREGTVREVLVATGDIVEADQPLAVIR